MTLFTNRSAPTSLTDSMGTVAGTADDTLAAVPACTVADASSTAAGSANASIVVIRNNLRDLTAKVNALISAFRDQ